MKKWCILLTILFIIPSVSAYEMNCTLTDEYKEYINLPEEERKTLIEPAKCQEVVELNEKTTAAKGKAYEIIDEMFGSSASDSSYRSPYVSSVKNQFHDGTCWAFTTAATLEANAMKNGFTNPLNLSVSHLIYSLYGGMYSDAQGKKNKYNLDAQSGGAIFTAPPYAFGDHGQLTESEWGYTNPNLPVITSSQYKTGDKMFSVSTYDIINMSEGNSCSQNQIRVMKNAILDYGALYGTMYMDESKLNNREYYYVEATPGEGLNHAVTVIGWDDNIPASYFNGATRNGGWLIKNSWGTDWGNQGYFYVSYDDNYICKATASYSGVSSTTYNNTYESIPAIGNIYLVSSKYKVARTFTKKTSGNELLKRVSFVVPPSGTYKVYLTKDSNINNKDSWVLLTSGSANTLGIDSIDVSDQIIDTDKFTIIEEFINTGGTAAFASCYEPSGTDSELQYVEFKSNESFDSENDEPFKDLYSNEERCAPVLYAYTDNHAAGASVIEINNTNVNKEKTTITYNGHGASINSIKIYQSGNIVTNHFTITYNDGSIVIDNKDKLSGSFVIEITDNYGDTVTTLFTLQERLNVNSSNLSLNNKTIKTVNPSVNGMTFNQLLNNIEVQNSRIVVKNNNGGVVSGGIIGTGYSIELNNSKYYIVIIGDLDSNGKMSPIDYVRLRKYLMGNGSLNNYEQLAADMNNDGSISPVDYVRIRKKLME